MSKKDLGKTVIEGGRPNSNKWERRNSHAEERAWARDFCAKAKIDPEYGDENFINHKKVYKEFNDKLKPMYKWLRSQVGNPWNAVYSLIREKFDIRSTPGRHVVFDHLLSSVDKDSDNQFAYVRRRDTIKDPTTSYREFDFYVDDDGILREKTKLSYRRKEYSIPVKTDVVATWLNGRIAGQVGSKMYWFIPVSRNGWSDEWKCQWDNANYFFNNLIYLKLEYEPIYKEDKEKGKIIVDRKPIWKEPFFWKFKKIPARQQYEFSKDDYETWKGLPQWVKDKILAYAPNAEKPPETRWY